MNNKNILRLVLLLFAMSVFSISSYGQVEGESEVTTVIIRKPAEEKQVQHQAQAIKTFDQTPDIPEAKELAIDAYRPVPGDTNHALLIGIDNYPDPELTDLDNPVSDAKDLYETLTTYYTFDPENVVFLENPTRADIINELDRLSALLTSHDNLVIFYAGHGYYDQQRETGFWLPSDADHNSSVNWLRNSTIQDYVDDLNTRHTLLITDACFAGSILFKPRSGLKDASASVNKLYTLPSRKAMTSGSKEEQVPDNSVFQEFLIKRLREFDGKYLSAWDLYSSLRQAVLNNSTNTPYYRVIQNTGDEGGDFIFIRR